jgi:hypothetical protein
MVGSEPFAFSILLFSLNLPVTCLLSFLQYWNFA